MSMPANYTLERDNRELQQGIKAEDCWKYYTLERDNRELQQQIDVLARNLGLYP